MYDQTAFQSSLIKPMFAVIALMVLNAAVIIAIEIYRFIHMQPSSNIYILWLPFSNGALISAWIFYIQMRRRKALRQQ